MRSPRRTRPAPPGAPGRNPLAVALARLADEMDDGLVARWLGALARRGELAGDTVPPPPPPPARRPKAKTHA
jgi:hypothetical protein